MSEKEQHRDHSRKIALRCAEEILREWPTLHLNGYDVDEAARVVESCLPECIVESEIAMQSVDEAEPAPDRDTSQSLGNRLRRALGVDGVSTLEAVELAIQRLKEART